MKTTFTVLLILSIASCLDKQKLNVMHSSNASRISQLLLSNCYPAKLDTFEIHSYIVNDSNKGGQVEHTLTDGGSDTIKVRYNYICEYPCQNIKSHQLIVNDKIIAFDEITSMHPEFNNSNTISYRLNFDSMLNFYHFNVDDVKYLIFYVQPFFPNYARINSNLIILRLDDPSKSSYLEVLDIDLLRGSANFSDSGMVSIPVALETLRDTIILANIFNLQFSKVRHPSLTGGSLLQLPSSSDRYFVLPDSFYVDK